MSEQVYKPWTMKELVAALETAREWAQMNVESLDDFHAYAQRFGCKPGANVFDFVLEDALRQRGLTWQGFHAAKKRETGA